MANQNLISDLQNQGFVITSDPTWFSVWGYRNLWQYGIWADGYSNGWHRAYDLAKYHNAPIRSGVNGTVLQGTGFGGFGYQLVLGFIAKNGKKYQVIYGHLNRNPLFDFKVGQNVKKGQVVAYQGASNNLNVSMASHLHIQVQHYQYYNEYNFIVNGINPLNIDISSTKPTSGATPTKATKPASKPASNSSGGFNKRKGRKTRAKAYAKGVVRNSDGLGAAQYRWSGGNFTNRFWPDIKEGEEVWIFATTASGWGKIYSPNHKGWVYLDRVQITQVF